VSKVELGFHAGKEIWGIRDLNTPWVGGEGGGGGGEGGGCVHQRCEIGPCGFEKLGPKNESSELISGVQK